MREPTASGGKLGAKRMAPAVNKASASPCAADKAVSLQQTPKEAHRRLLMTCSRQL